MNYKEINKLDLYIVGGYVRDSLLGRDSKDMDFVVVGSTPEQMIELGFQQVGSDFPVFLDDLGREFALARTERKTSSGYHGFETDFNPSITLEEDLYRRDLTINAMAQKVALIDEEGVGLYDEVIDPHGGQVDLEYQILRHVSHHFREDPVRLLRTARFAARYEFDVAGETLTMLKDIVNHGEIDHLVPERVWQEVDRACSEPHVECFFGTLSQVGALKVLMPHVDEIYTLAARELTRAENAEQVFSIFSICLSVDEICETVENMKAPSNLCQMVKAVSSVAPMVASWGLYRHRDAEEAMKILETCGAWKSWQKSTDTGSTFVIDVLIWLSVTMSDADLIVKTTMLSQLFQLVMETGFSDLTTDQHNTLVGKEISDAIRAVKVQQIQSFLNRCSFL